jgi:Tfp pilus assembly protein PilZ
MQRRRHVRTKKRISCTLVSGDQRYSGVVLDCSPQGLFVQTSAKLTLGAMVDIELGVSTQPEPLLVQARVARQKLVPPQLRSVAQGGIGLQIDLPPQGYLEFFAELTRTELPTADRRKKPRPEPKLRYRVRLVQIGGSRSRRVNVECNTLDEAEVAALAAVGEGWKVIKIDPA